jgi:hypothetical protein
MGGVGAPPYACFNAPDRGSWRKQPGSITRPIIMEKIPTEPAPVEPVGYDDPTCAGPAPTFSKPPTVPPPVHKQMTIPPPTTKAPSVAKKPPVVSTAVSKLPTFVFNPEVPSFKPRPATDIQRATFIATLAKSTNPLTAAQVFPDTPPPMGVPVSHETMSNAVLSKSLPPLAGPIHPTVASKDTLLGVPPGNFQKSLTIPSDPNHCATTCPFCSDLGLDIKNSIPWHLNTGILDTFYGCSTIMLTCPIPNRVQRFPFQLDYTILEPRFAQHVIMPHWTIVFDFQGIILPIVIRTPRDNTLMSKSAGQRILYKVERRLQDYGIYLSAYEFAILCHFPPDIYTFVPRAQIRHCYILAGYPHENRYVLHARLINARIWNMFELDHFIHYEKNKALNPKQRSPAQLPKQPLIPSQPFLPPAIARFVLPTISPAKQAYLKSLPDLDNLKPPSITSLPKQKLTTKPLLN